MVPHLFGHRSSLSDGNCLLAKGAEINEKFVLNDDNVISICKVLLAYMVGVIYDPILLG